MIGRIGTLAVAGSMIVGLVGASPAGAEERAVLNRDDEDGYVISAIDDDDNDGDVSLTGTGGSNTNDDASGVSNDATGSGFTSVSRDNDYSRGDKTRDWTRDGGDRTRDHSAHNTNDASRNDTR